MITLLGIAAAAQIAADFALFRRNRLGPPAAMLGLVWTATLGAMAAYCLVLIYYAWWLIGWTKYYSTPELRIPRSTEAIFLLSLGAAGLMAGKLCGRRGVLCRGIR